MLKFKSLQKRLLFFILLPVALLLTTVGIVGFIYAHKSLMAQWQEAAELRMQRAAHQIDMRLSAPQALIQTLGGIADEPGGGHLQQLIVEELKKLHGVSRVALTLGPEDVPNDKIKSAGGHPSQATVSHGHIPEASPPHYDHLVEHETISLVYDIPDRTGRTSGVLEVALSFDYLVSDILDAKWRTIEETFLVDRTGAVLTCSVPGGRRQLGKEDSPIEQAIVRAMANRDYGTVFGPGHPVSEIGIFYKLHKAPWFLVVIAPGKKILAPINTFLSYYLAVGILIVLAILFLIRSVAGGTVTAVKAISRAAEDLADGRFCAPLAVKSRDEVGELARNFNTMTVQLQERMQIKQSLNLAMEIQQNLLPREPICCEGLDIAGTIKYCEEIGGDYFDILRFPEWGKHKTAVAVGDVTGHGIGAALLMATTRALLRSRATQPGGPSAMVTDLNRRLCDDAASTGNFVSLFILFLDTAAQEIRWVRAGQDPAIGYDSATDQFFELNGEGIVLGIDENRTYPEYRMTDWIDGKVILIGTDGVWETVNAAGKPLGKDFLRHLIRNNWRLPAEEILRQILQAIDDFRHDAPQQDDITLVVIKPADR